MNKDVDKGVVLKILENQYLIVLTRSGEFVKAQYQKCRVGEKISFQRLTPIRKWLSVTLWAIGIEI
jgi:hypothetical protein